MRTPSGPRPYLSYTPGVFASLAIDNITELIIETSKGHEIARVRNKVMATTSDLDGSK